MKKATVTALVLALFCLLPLRAEAVSYYRETTISDGLKIVFTERVAIPSQYITAYTYANCGVLAPDGTFLVEPVYQSIYAPVEGRALFYKAGEGYGYFDEDWNVVIPAQYQTANSFSAGLATVSDVLGTVACIDRQGNAVEPVRYSQKANSFNVLMSENRIDINGTVYENDSLTYPFINYQDCSYIPLTYGTCRALGFSCLWNAEDGMVLTSTPDRRGPELGGNTMRHGAYGKATLYTGKLTIDGKSYTAADFYYPLLFYRDIIYLPVLYCEGMERLGIQYSYRLGEGNTTPGYMVFTHN